MSISPRTPNPFPVQTDLYVSKEGVSEKPWKLRHQSPKMVFSKSSKSSKSSKNKREFSLDLSPVPEPTGRFFETRSSPIKRKKEVPVKESSKKEKSIPKPTPTTITLFEFFKRKTLNFSETNGTICHSLKTGEIQINHEVGKGKYGKVFEIDFMGKQGKYVVKEMFSKNIPECTNTVLYYKRLDTLREVSFPQDSFICDDAKSEFMISLLASGLLSKSPNFIETYYLAVCGSEHYKSYTFMEKIDTTLRNLINYKYAIYFYESLYIQVIHALATIQTEYMIVHGDLHLENVFIKYVDNPEKLNYFEYKVGNTNIYIPFCPFIAKIGDWGMAVKYKNPVIASKLIISGIYDDKFGVPIIPNFYSAAYDVAYVTILMNYYLPHSELIKNCLAWILKCEPQNITNNLERGYNMKIYYNYRPKIEELALGTLSHVNAVSLLTNPKLMQQYYDRPKNANIKVMGTL